MTLLQLTTCTLIVRLVARVILPAIVKLPLITAVEPLTTTDDVVNAFAGVVEIMG